jgi:orotidine-5'-phosphate decarboxylase
MNESQIIVALDYASRDAANQLVERLDPAQCKLKVGKELFVAAGPDYVSALVQRGYDVFLDLKFHDIPNTVAAACRAAAQLGVWMINVHALGGRAMMEAAREALENTPTRPKLIAVTLLTSLQDDELIEIGIVGSTQQSVSNLANLTQSCGLDGVVCSAREVSRLRRERGKDFLLVTPGIRPEQTERGDQARIATPQEAIQNGSSYLVIGRPITQAPDPLAALAAIQQEIAAI